MVPWSEAVNVPRHTELSTCTSSFKTVAWPFSSPVEGSNGCAINAFCRTKRRYPEAYSALDGVNTTILFCLPSIRRPEDGGVAGDIVGILSAIGKLTSA